MKIYRGTTRIALKKPLKSRNAGQRSGLLQVHPPSSGAHSLCAAMLDSTKDKLSVIALQKYSFLHR